MKRSLPKNYQIIFDAIKAAGPGSHVSANELFVLLRDRHGHFSQTTVYRGLERLVASGLIDQVAAPNAGHSMYELATHAHAHFRCRLCGALRDVALPFSYTELRERADLRDVSVERTGILFEGLCAACR